MHALLVPLLLAAVPAPPADPVAEKARAKIEGTPGADAAVKVTAEVGTSLARGNTETLHLHGDARVVWVPVEKWVSTSRGKALYEEASAEMTARSWLLSERVDRFLGKRLAVFGGAAVESDVFAGIARRTSGQAGVSYLVLDVHDAAREDLLTDRLSVELGGYGASEQHAVAPNAPAGTAPGPDVTIAAVRGAAAYVHAFEKGSEVGLEAEVIQDFVETDNLVTQETAYAAAAFVEGLSVKLAATHKYDALPADPTLEPHDLLVTGAVVVSF